MQLSKKSIRLIQLSGFILLLGLMVVLNNRIEKSSSNTKHQTETYRFAETNNTGIAPLSAQVPINTEGALPIKLISNPNSPFLVFINKSIEFKNNYQYIQNRKQFLCFSGRLQISFIVELIISARNKDIR